MNRIASLAIPLSAILLVASCSGQSAWEENSEIRSAPANELFESAYSTPVVIERYNEIFERDEVIGTCGGDIGDTPARIAISGSTLVDIRTKIFNGESKSFVGGPWTHNYDWTLGEVLAHSDWVALNC